MITYRTISHNDKPYPCEIPDKIKCDKCGVEYQYHLEPDDDQEQIANDMEIQEFVHIREQGGYGSVFGDLVKIKYDICQHCLFKWLNDNINNKDLNKGNNQYE